MHKTARAAGLPRAKLRGGGGGTGGSCKKAVKRWGVGGAQSSFCASPCSSDHIVFCILIAPYVLKPTKT